jgi:hypothetical protein
MWRKIIDYNSWEKFWNLVLLWSWLIKVSEKTLFKCYCGNIFTSTLNSIKQWKTISCWCSKKNRNYSYLQNSSKNKIHWLSRKRFANIYFWARKRCYQKNRKDYNNYWWRWIIVEWKNFQEYYEDMYNSYLEHSKRYWEKNTTLDRIDVNGNYSTSNCRWSTLVEQANNKTINIYATYKWETYTKSEWLRILGFIS